MKDKIEFKIGCLEYAFSLSVIGVMFSLGFLPFKIHYKENNSGNLDSYVTFCPMDLITGEPRFDSVFKINVNKVDFNPPCFNCSENFTNSSRSMPGIPCVY
jgi:hypothetical protein